MGNSAGAAHARVHANTRRATYRVGIGLAVPGRLMGFLGTEGPGTPKPSGRGRTRKHQSITKGTTYRTAACAAGAAVRS